MTERKAFLNVKINLLSINFITVIYALVVYAKVELQHNVYLTET